MNKPLIGLTSYSRCDKNRFAIPATYLEAIERANGIPVVITPTTKEINPLLDKIDAFVLTGGADVDPAFYAGKAHEKIYGINEERDQLELELASKIAEKSVPALAICRGLQVLNIALGGTLVEHIPDEYGESIAHRQDHFEYIDHEVTVKPDSRLAGILQETKLDVPSYHHQSVRKPAPGFEVVAESPDGVIEAIESADLPGVIAIQWHPEVAAHKVKVHQRLFDQLVIWATHGATHQRSELELVATA